MKYPADAWVYQEILFETKPELIIETGTYRGGGALFLATICDALGMGRIVTIDSEAPQKDQPLPEHRRIKYIVGSSIDPTVLEQVRTREHAGISAHPRGFLRRGPRSLGREARAS